MKLLLGFDVGFDDAETAIPVKFCSRSEPFVMLIPATQAWPCQWVSLGGPASLLPLSCPERSERTQRTTRLLHLKYFIARVYVMNPDDCGRSAL